MLVHIQYFWRLKLCNLIYVPIITRNKGKLFWFYCPMQWFFWITVLGPQKCFNSIFGSFLERECRRQICLLSRCCFALHFQVGKKKVRVILFISKSGSRWNLPFSNCTHVIICICFSQTISGYAQNGMSRRVLSRRQFPPQPGAQFQFFCPIPPPSLQNIPEILAPISCRWSHPADNMQINQGEYLSIYPSNSYIHFRY